VLLFVSASAGAATGQQLSRQSCHAEAAPTFEYAVAQVPVAYAMLSCGRPGEWPCSPWWWSRAG